LDNFDNKGRKVCCKVSLYKNCQRQSCSAINCLSSGINILSGRRQTYFVAKWKRTCLTLPTTPENRLQILALWCALGLLQYQPQREYKHSLTFRVLRCTHLQCIRLQA